SGSLSSAANAASAGTSIATCAPKSMRLSYHPPIRRLVTPPGGSPMCRGSYGLPTGPIYWYSAHSTQTAKLPQRINASLRNSAAESPAFANPQTPNMTTNVGLAAALAHGENFSSPPMIQPNETMARMLHRIVAGTGITTFAQGL